MYENHVLLSNSLLIMHMIVVWISNIIPIARGCFICVNRILVSALVDKRVLMISEGILR
jgi:hypothetical protein